MKLLTNFAKSILLTTLITVISCTNSTQPTVTEFSLDNNSVQMGIENSGNFNKIENKTFKSADNIVLKFKVNGLTVKNNKVKTNIDLFLKKDKNVLGTETDILGENGLEQSITGNSMVGSADIQINIAPPSEVTGDLIANITLKDLNNSSKLITFETKFTVN